MGLQKKANYEKFEGSITHYSLCQGSWWVSAFLINQFEYCLEPRTQFDLVFRDSSQLNWNDSENTINKHELSWIRAILAHTLMDIVIFEIKKSIISFIKILSTLFLKSLGPLIDMSCEK